jgi:hypothetical protein
MSSSLITRSGPSWRAVILVVVGMVLGALVIQPSLAAVSGAGSQAAKPAAASRVGWASCADYGFLPDYEGGFYSNVGSGGVRPGRSGDVPMYCALSLPHLATITTVSFHFEDDLDNGAISDCILGRTRLNPPNDTYQVVAGPVTSGMLFDGRFVTRTDTSITLPTVNNRYYAYWARCVPSFTNTGLILYGVTIRYTVA